MGRGDQDRGVLPDFDRVIWGYDREQVDRCVGDLTSRLEAAMQQRDAVELLQGQLCEAQVEVAHLQQEAEAEPPRWSRRLSTIMETAEELRRRAERAARQAGG